MGYFEWLLDNMNMLGTLLERRYARLLIFLANTEFTWIEPTDENRANDGTDLRQQYEDICGEPSGMDGKPCTVLEMMIALALRIEINITGEPGDDHPEKWFWTMIQNLGLDRAADRNFYPDEVESIVERWLDRKYDAHGQGSPFPTSNPELDQRIRPIWEQACGWLIENQFSDI